MNKRRLRRVSSWFTTTTTTTTIRPLLIFGSPAEQWLLDHNCYAIRDGCWRRLHQALQCLTLEWIGPNLQHYHHGRIPLYLIFSPTLTIQILEQLELDLAYLPWTKRYTHGQRLPLGTWRLRISTTPYQILPYQISAIHGLPLNTRLRPQASIMLPKLYLSGVITLTLGPTASTRARLHT